MIKLYKSSIHADQWIAQVPATGWVIFPATGNGWESRRTARGVDPLYLREVPIECAANTGILGSLAIQKLLRVA